MFEIYLHDISYALGSQRQSIETAASRKQLFSGAELMRESGFSFHHISDYNETPYDLAKRALDKLSTARSAGGATLESIDALLYSTCLTLNGNLGDPKAFAQDQDVKHLMDFPASHLQAEFKLDRAFVQGINQTACTSLLGAIRLARALLIAEDPLQEILCITADRFPPGAKYEQGFNVISDAAAGCIVSKTPGPFKILHCHHLTNGAMAQASDDETAGFYFNYSHRLITESLSALGKTIDDIAWIVPQNTNIKAWQVLSSLLGIDFKRVYMPTLADIGHCISGDNLINLKHACDTGIFSPGEVMLLPMAGFGLNWSCIVLEVV